MLNKNVNKRKQEELGECFSGVGEDMEGREKKGKGRLFLSVYITK